MFSKISLFSGLNNLEDISLDPRFAAVCGYRGGGTWTGCSRRNSTVWTGTGIRTWYDGYNWRGGERVYNPYDVLLLLRNREFRPYWFETGSPDFLFRMLAERSVSPMELEGRLADMELVSKFDVGDIGHRGAALPDRLPHHRGGACHRGGRTLSPRLSQS